MTDEPFSIFDSWFAEAQASEPNDPNAMTLATADKSGMPSARTVLLKGHGRDIGAYGGFVFYTNSRSNKGSDLKENPQVALLFHWKSLRRQIRISGPIDRVSDETANAYFASRPRISQLGAWASDQSQPLETRAELERRLAEAEARFEGKDVTRPPHWWGYCVTPKRFEFWQDRKYRLHERRFFERDESAGEWRTGMLFP